MTTLQKEDYVFAVEVENTRNYYALHDVCECDYCLNYQAAIKDVFPDLEAFLSEFGVDISRPDEINFFFEVGNEIHYLEIDYTVCGSITRMGEGHMTVSDALPFKIVITDGFSSPNDQTSDYFTLSVTNEFSLPWVLSKPFPGTKKPTLWERIRKLSGQLRRIPKQ